VSGLTASGFASLAADVVIDSPLVLWSAASAQEYEGAGSENKDTHLACRE